MERPSEIQTAFRGFGQKENWGRKLSSESFLPQTPSFKDFRRYRIPVRRDFRVGRKRGGRFGKRQGVVLFWWKENRIFFRWQREKREGKTTKACLPLLFSLGPQKKNIISESRRTSGGRVKPFTLPAVLRAFWGNSTQRAATPWPLGGLAGLTGSASDFSKTG